MLEAGLRIIIPMFFIGFFIPQLLHVNNTISIICSILILLCSVILVYTGIRSIFNFVGFKRRIK
jgi:predicted branched-subunit amino acid permease